MNIDSTFTLLAVSISKLKKKKRKKKERKEKKKRKGKRDRDRYPFTIHDTKSKHEVSDSRPTVPTASEPLSQILPTFTLTYITTLEESPYDLFLACDQSGEEWENMQAYGRAFPSGTCLRETPTPKHLRVVRMFISSWGFAYLAYPRFKWKYLLSNYRLFKDACSWSVIGSDRSSCLSEKSPLRNHFQSLQNRLGLIPKPYQSYQLHRSYQKPCHHDSSC